MSGNPTTTEKKYHEKAVFALYLNQAVHNIQLALKVNDDKKIKPALSNLTINDADNSEIATKKRKDLILLERNWFRFLKSEVREHNQKVEILQMLVDRLKNLRNYYSHGDHLTGQIFRIELPDQNEESQHIRSYLKGKFLEIFQSESIQGKFSQKEVAEIQSDFPLFKALTKTVKKKKEISAYRFTPFGTLFLASFFLTKRQINLFRSQLPAQQVDEKENLKSLKAVSTKRFRAGVEVFKHFHLATPQSELVAENPQAKFFITLADYLNKAPAETIEEGFTEYTDFRITSADLLKSELPDKVNEKLQKIAGKLFLGKTKFLKQLDSTFRNEKLGEELEYKIMDLAKKEPNLRSERDRFSLFALEYLEANQLMPKFSIARQKVSTKETKKIINDRESVFPSHQKEMVFYTPTEEKTIEETEKERKIERYDFYLHKNQVVFAKNLYVLTKSILNKAKNTEGLQEITDEQWKEIYESLDSFLDKQNRCPGLEKAISGKLKSSSLNLSEEQISILVEFILQNARIRLTVSTHELRNMLAGFLLGNAGIENKIDSFLTERVKYYLAYLKEGETAETQQKMGLPQRLLEEEGKSLQERVLSKLRHLEKIYGSYLKKENVEQVSLGEMVKQIAKFGMQFLNRDQRAILSAKKYQEMEKQISFFEWKKDEKTQQANLKKPPFLLKTLEDWGLDEAHEETSLYSLAKNPNNDSVEKLFKAVIEEMLNWCEKKHKFVTDNAEPENWRKTADLLNKSEKVVFDENDEEEIRNKKKVAVLQKAVENNYLHNIPLPKGFMKEVVFGLKHEILLTDENGKLEERKGKRKGNLKQPNISSQIVHAENDKKLLGKFYKAHFKNGKTQLPKNIYQSFVSDKLVYLMATKTLKKLGNTTSNQEWAISFHVTDRDGNQTNSPKVKDLMNAQVKVSNATKTIQYTFKSAYKIIELLNDRRLEKLFSTYLTDYEEEAEDGFNFKTIKEAMTKVDSEQLALIDAVLKFEETVLKTLPYDKKKALRIETDEKDENRIEFEYLLREKGIDVESEEVKDIIKARNKAFHNDLYEQKFSYYVESLKEIIA
jgi:hypothetical protein